MSDLLTHDEYAAIAAELDFPRTAFIDGKFAKGSGGEFLSVNPATNETLCTISACNAADVDLAVSLSLIHI